MTAADEAAEDSASNTQRPWHQLPGADVEAALESPPAGLQPAEVAARLQRVGPNELPKGAGPGWAKRLLSQFRNPLLPILLIAATISAGLGQVVESAAIFVIVAFSAALGFAQETRAIKALDALRQLAAPRARVIRSGHQQSIPARELVPGDRLLLQAGDRVPADLRLLECANLRVEESALTGESEPVDKSPEPFASDADLPLGDQCNMGWAGTLVSYGRGAGVVVATGAATEMGRLARLLQTVERDETPLQVRLRRLARLLAGIAAIVAVAVLVSGLLRGAPLLEMLIFGIALGVAVVPEALPAVVTIGLSLGVQRMARRQALIRHLPAVETLGSVTVICTDKTGTLTQDRMTLRRVLLADLTVDLEAVATETGQPNPHLADFLAAGALASDARPEREEDGWSVAGDPTEAALVQAAVEHGQDPIRLGQEQPRIDEIPFSSERKYMTVLVKSSDGGRAYTKGAPEVVLGLCEAEVTAQGEQPLAAARREYWLGEARAMAGEGLRVLAVASRRTESIENADQELCLLGLAGIQDPPRPEAAAAIARCNEAGVRSVMITGDHPETARAIGAELGLLAGGRVLTGPDLSALSDQQLCEEVESIDIYARVSPEHKLRIVDAWQARGEIVAMTGDGINDAPALRSANVGIAMGITGTEVSREAADMTLADDNFATIVAAIEEGRKIYDNIKKFIVLMLTTNLGEIGLVAGATVLGRGLPLSAVQLLFVNLATDGPPAVALAAEPAEADVMNRPPRDPVSGIFDQKFMLLLVVGGAWTTAATLGVYLWAGSAGHSQATAMSMCFACLILIEFCQAYSFRVPRQWFFHRPFANRWLNLAIVLELAALLALIYSPWLQAAFGTVALEARDWIVVVAAAVSILPALELTKAFWRWRIQQ
ncbi:MAG: HAD-IC family P-type ATPase [Gammaproteobacteria bacterium]|nr:HAD-IC family P-type ATPase [Gammaproteobacteria bacterium]